MSRVNKVSRHCNVCFQAGKCKEEYGSHWTSENGRIICLTLLNQACRHCGDLGHTPKYCQKLAKEKADGAKYAHFVGRQERIRTYKETSKKPSASVVPATSRFAILMDDDEETESSGSPRRTQKKAPAVVEEFPQLPSKSNVAIWPEHAPETLRGKPMAWTDMITMARGVMDGYVAPEMSGLFDLKRESKEMSQREKAAVIHRQECFKGLNGKGWADLDSDDEDW